MKARITIITLGVDDLDRSLTFYQDGLGLPTQGIIGQEFEHGAVVFFELEHGVKLALWPRTSIAHDTHLSVQAPSATDFTLAHNVNSKEEVDLVMEQAKAAGPRSSKRHKRPSMEAMPAISRIPISMSGKSPGIPSSCLNNTC